MNTKVRIAASLVLVLVLASSNLPARVESAELIDQPVLASPVEDKNKLGHAEASDIMQEDVKTSPAHASIRTLAYAEANLVQRVIPASPSLVGAGINEGERSAFGKRKADPQAETSVVLLVRSRKQANFNSELSIASPKLARSLANAKPRPTTGKPLSLISDIEVQVTKGSAKSLYRLDNSGALWSEADGIQLILDQKGADMLLRSASTLRSQHYGKLVSWKDMKRLLPNRAIFTVTELDSGLTFRVQRRAGSDHADVQPVTKQDTETMKQVYAEGWSWNRKAVLVHAGDQWVAASMNGMPHGGDGIPENGFSGHFCIHFLGSSTHKSDRPDLAHQLMVYKAAGELPSYFASASPSTLAGTFIAVMNHKDEELLQQLSAGLPVSMLSRIVAEMKELRSIRVMPTKKSGDSINRRNPDDSGGNDSERLAAEVAIPVSLESSGKGRSSRTYLFSFQRSTPSSPWLFIEVLW